MKYFLLIALVFIIGCPEDPDITKEQLTETSGFLECIQGELGCECDGNCLCSPSNICTIRCQDDEECAPAACLSNYCAIPCDPLLEDGGCSRAGLPETECMLIEHIYVCGIKKAEEDETN